MPPRRDRSSILFDLFAASQQVKSLLAAAMADADLRADDYAIYSALFEFGPLTSTELGRVVGMPATTVSHYIRAMRDRNHLEEARRFVARVAEPGEAARALREIEEAAAAALAELMSEATAEAG